MATLQNIKDEVTAHADTVYASYTEESPNRIRATIYYKLSSTGAGNLSRYIFVKDPGLPTEAAYWDGTKPEYITGADNFLPNVKTACDAYRTAHPEFERYQIINAFSVEQYAIVKWYVWNSVALTSSEKMYTALKSGTVWTMREMA
jgi:hypothetical protein